MPSLEPVPNSNLASWFSFWYEKEVRFVPLLFLCSTSVILRSFNEYLTHLTDRLSISSKLSLANITICTWRTEGYRSVWNGVSWEQGHQEKNTGKTYYTHHKIEEKLGSEFMPHKIPENLTKKMHFCKEPSTFFCCSDNCSLDFVSVGLINLMRGAILRAMQWLICVKQLIKTTTMISEDQNKNYWSY